MPSWIAVFWHARQGRAAPGCPLGELRSVAGPENPSPSLDIAGAFQLRAQDCGVQLRRQVTRADVYPGVLLGLAAEEGGAVRPFLAQDLGALHQRGIVHEQRATFAAGYVLGF